jgi:NAD(P) transhydrogenase subunit alpha
MAPLDLPSAMPQHASMLYAKNVLALITHLVKNGELVLDMDDEITKGVCVTRDGQILNEAVRSKLQGVGA